MAQNSTMPSSAVPGRPCDGTALEAVRREFRRSRGSRRTEGWSAGRLREQLPRVALDEALEIVLAWRGQPRFDTGAVAWHARIAGHCPALTLDDAGRALTALREFGGSNPEVGALALRAVCERHHLDDVAAVLSDWLEQRQSFGGL
jgi:hypothetical protein